MPWLTDVLGAKVVGPSGRQIGRVQDLRALRGRYPKVTALKVKLDSGGRTSLGTQETEVLLGIEGTYLEPNRMRFASDPIIVLELEADLDLASELLDRQIVDTEGARVVRVNDILLSDSLGGWRVVGVDVGFSGVLRRLGLERLFSRVAAALGYQLPEKLIAWNYVAQLEKEGTKQVRLTVPTRLLRDLHPSELADILDQLDATRREQWLRVMTVASLAETLPETDPEVSREAFNLMSEERARRVIELMPPDEAADLLGAVGYQKAEKLLAMMGVQTASTLRELLGHPPDTAGGRMTPSYIELVAGTTVKQAIENIRKEAHRAETVNYAYVVDAEGKLIGVLSLRELLIGSAWANIEDLMIRDVISVEVDEDQQEVARIMSRYNLLAIPVLDDGRLRGIVTVDDVVDVMQEEASEDLAIVAGVYLGQGSATSGRLAGFGISLAGGAVGALMLQANRGVLSSASVIAVAWLLPLYLRTSQDLGTWSLARALSASLLGTRARLDVLAQELMAALASSAVAGVIVATFASTWTKNSQAGAFLGVGIFVGSLTASVIGLGMPSVAQALKLDRLLGRGRLLAIGVGLSSILIYAWALSSLSERLS